MNLEFHTKRLRLTPLSNADLDLSLEMFTDPEVVEYVCDLMTEQEIREGMTDWIKRGGNGCIGIWCVSDRNTGEKYGSALLLPLPIDEDDTNYDLVVPNEMPECEVEIGFALKRSAWGRGFATEACVRLMKFAFEESPLEELVATFDDENTASRHVLEKAGLINCGRMLCYGEDNPCYRITRNKWLREARRSPLS